MKKKLIILMLISFSLLSAEMLNYDKVLSNLKGIKYYKNGEYDKAGEAFEDNAIQHPNDPRLQFNQGNAQYKNGNLEEAENSYNMALKNPDFKDKSLAHQNLGNVKFQQKDYKNAIKHYRDALIQNPDNLDARYNYELAARMLQKQQQQQQNQQQQQQNDDKKENEDQQKQQQQQQDQQKKDEEKKDQQQQQKKEENKDQQPQEEQKTEKQKAEEKKKEDAEKILKALLQKEKEEMKKEKQKMNVDKAKEGKYW
ncbi:MAG: tetratricopeptide repeat protein [Candidatus Cloacimonetes bacterium]|nr:tetratricopeptide repeat protein [Candidatus Cloacimonadota bacterium]MCF7813577.1 tetratricopeptide repeat protein [Candidatus Cloacimonadota bacterium]MCF7868208.1 tetratricopeptide repeat protein [Candidatus Cloacimonadota bacterium]MCF7883628.1 tetratricopeptide repeat protein [Candidatus Cloacimonadota bacterium]